MMGEPKDKVSQENEESTEPWRRALERFDYIFLCEIKLNKIQVYTFNCLSFNVAHFNKTFVIII